MSSDDPFQPEDDGNRRTIMVPSPGRQSGARAAVPRPPPARGDQRIAPPTPPPGPRAGGQGPGPSVHLPSLGVNPLVDAAASLLILAPELRRLLSYPEPAKLYAYVGAQIKAFEKAARASGYADETVRVARYALCSFMDESVLSTPWGSESQWPARSLLSAFHRETSGGERFFSLLGHYQQDAATNIDLLELMYLCLALGFEGKYAIENRGHSRLIQIQENLAQIIAMQRGDYERELSPHWQGVPDQRNRLVRYVPLWVVCSLAGVILLGMYTGFRVGLSNAAQPVYQELEAITELVDRP